MLYDFTFSVYPPMEYQDPKTEKGFLRNRWVKVFKNGPSKICGRQLLKNLKFFKGYLPQILLGPFVNTLTQMSGKFPEKTQKKSGDRTAML